MKLTYFHVRGRVDPIRLLLELHGAPYEFEGISVEAWRGGAKERILACTPFGQMPVLEDDGLVLCQSQAILRHVARELGRAGETREQMARIDEVCEAACDALLELGRIFWDPDFGEKRAAHREATHARLARLETYFGRTSDDGVHWAIPDRWTAADASMAYALETLLPLHPGLVEEFPALDRAMRAFFAAEGVRDYVRSARRPQTWTVPMARFGGKREETHQWGQGAG